MTTGSAGENRAPSGFDACDHVDLEHLGRDGTASFDRCRACGVITIAQGGRLWALRPTLKERGGRTRSGS